MEYAAQDEGVKKACAILESLSGNKELRQEAEARLKAWRDEQDRIDGAREEGREEGKKDVARKLLSMSLPLDSIVTATGLSPEQISLLR